MFLTCNCICLSQEINVTSNKDLNITSFDISKNGHKVAVVVFPLSETIIYDSFSGTELMRLSGYETTPKSVYFDDIKNNIIVEHNTKVDVWDSTNYQLIQSYQKPEFCISTYVSVESGKIVFLNKKSFTILNIHTGEQEEIDRNKKDEFYYNQKVKLSKNGNVVFILDNLVLNIYHKDKNYKQPTKIPFKGVIDFSVGNNTYVTLKGDANNKALFQYFDLKGKPINKEEKLDYSFVSYNDIDRMHQLDDGLIFFQSYIYISPIGKDNRSFKLTFSEKIKNFTFLRGLGFGINYGKYLDFTDFEGGLFSRINVSSIYHSSSFVEENSNENTFLLNENKIQFNDKENGLSAPKSIDSYYVNKFSKSGNLLAFATRDKKIRIWNIATKKEESVIETNESSYPQFLQVSDKDIIIAVLYQNSKKVILINIATNQIIKTISFTDESPRALNLKNGWLVIGTSKGNYYTWKIEGSKIIEELVKAKGLGNEISGVEIFEDHVYIASIGRILKAPLKKNNKPFDKLFKGHSSYIQAMSVDSSGKYLTSSSIDGTVKLWDLEKEHLLENYKTDATWVNQLMLFENLKIVGNGPGNMGVIFKNESLKKDLQNPNPELIIQSSNTNLMRQLAFSPNGKFLASIDGSTVKVREIKTGFLISEFTTQNNAVNDIVFDKDGKSLIVATGAGIEFIDPITGKSKKYLNLKMQNRSIHFVEAFHNRNAILGVNMHGWHYPIFYHSNSGKNVGKLIVNSEKERDNQIINLKISKDGQKIATYGSHFIKIFLFNDSGKTKQIVAIPRKQINSSNTYWNNLMDFSDDGKYLAYVEFEGNNRTVVYDIENQKEVYNKPGKLAKFGKDHNILLMTGDAFLKLKNLDNGEIQSLITTNQYHQNLITSLDYDATNELFASGDFWGNLKIWDSNTKKPLVELDRFDNDVYHSEISPKGNFIAYNSKTGIYLFDLEQFKIIRLKGNNFPYFGRFSKDGDLFYFRDNKNYKVYDLNKNTSKIIFDSKVSSDNASGTKLSNDGKLLFFRDKEKFKIIVFSLKTNTKIAEIDQKNIGDFTSIIISEIIDSNKMIIRATGLKNEKNKKIYLQPLEYNLKTQKVKLLADSRFIDLEDKFADFKIKSHSVVNSFSSIGDLYAYQENYHLKIKDLKTQKILYDMYYSELNIKYGTFTEDGKFMILAFNNGKIEIISTETFKVVKSFFGATSDVTTVDVKGRFLMVLGADDKINVFDIKNDFKKLFTTTFTGKGEFLIANEEGFYYASKGTINSVAFKKGTNVYPFEQFDLYYNRPDKAAKNLADLGIVDSVLTNAYYQAYQKRIKKMGFSENQLSGDFNLPEVKINSNNIPITVNTNNINIDIEAKDAIHNVDRINVWINDVPVFGSKGKSLKNLKSKQISQSLDLILTKGDNKVQISVTNIKGVESLKKTFKITCNIKEDKPTLYLISIGVSKYLNNNYNLKYAAKDAQDLSNYTQTLKHGYQKIETIELLNENVTTENVIKIKEQLLKTKVSDVVIVFYAGHGLIDDKLDYYLATHNIDFNDPSKKGLSYENLEGLLDGIPARKKLLLMDSCHSGEIDKDELEVINAEKSSNKNVTNRGTITVSNKSKKIGLKNSFELMQMLFADLKRGTGAMVISSASGVEYAYEGEQWKNGVFTYALLEGLKSGNCDVNKDGETSISEIRKYVIDKVGKLTNGNQNPTSRKENLEFDFKVW